MTEPHTPSAESPLDIGRLEAEQTKLSKQGRLHWVHWVIIALSMVITLVAWKTSDAALDAQNRLRFEREAERVINLMRERIAHYEDALLSGVAAMQTHDGDMSRADWKRYASHLSLTRKYPGVSGIGVIHYVTTEDLPAFIEKERQTLPGFRIHPEHLYDLSLPIIFIEPQTSNAAAIGLDIAFETNRRTAALIARTTGETQISGPIVLVQDEGKTPGFLFYAPYYNQDFGDQASWTAAQREARFQGLIYSPLVVKSLVAGVLSAENRHVTLTIRDGDITIYDEQGNTEPDGFALSEVIPMHGRDWTFDITSMPQLHQFGEVDYPAMILISGLSLEIMLLGLFWTMSRSNRRTLTMAESITERLAQQAQELHENNRDLESFAHVVSHDLKTPMRNIHTVVGIINEDYNDFLASNDAGADIKNYLNTVQEQVDRGQSLISGVLAYSSLGTRAVEDSSVDSMAMVESICALHDLSADQLYLQGSFPLFVTNATLLEQVFTNLIGNAVKYNPDTASAIVRVHAAERDGYFHFIVEDNGPGIEQRFHERIFEPFSTLSVDMDINSSGLGLSIVKRALDLQGGSISVVSGKGNGARFEFTWPAPESNVEYRYGTGPSVAA